MYKDSFFKCVLKCFNREDDVASEIQALSLQTKGNEESEEEETQPVKKKKVTHSTFLCGTLWSISF